jgi:uncharacterized protein YdaU (DUF1376 family)
MSNQWYPFFPGDYARDTARLSLVEHGAYRLLLDDYYSTGGPLPLEATELYRITKAFTPEEQAATIKVVCAFFTETEVGFRSRRADRELAEQGVKQEKRNERASKAAAARWEKERAKQQEQGGSDANAMLGASKTDACSNAYAMQPQPQPQPHLKPIPPPIKELPLTERMFREMVEEKREFIRTNYGLDDGEINIHLEEMVVKTRDRSPGPDLWLYASKFFKNRKDDIDGKRRRADTGGAAAPGGKTQGQRAAKAGGSLGGGVDAGQVSGGLDFEDRSDEWHKAL